MSRTSTSEPRHEDPTCGRPEVSVVIPCLNEANSIGTCVKKALRAFEAADIEGEVVVADNGSTDGSQELAAGAGAKVVGVRQRGYGNAVKVGVDAAQGQFVVMGDADDSYDFEDVPRFVEKWRAGYELVMGNRFAGEIEPGAMPWSHRTIGNPLLSGLLRMLFRAKVRDSQCGLRGFTKELFERIELRTAGMEFASELVIKATLAGATTTEIPITLRPDKRGRPAHLRAVPDGWRHLRFMLLMSPTWLFIGPGSILALIGTAALLWLAGGPRRVGHVVFDVNTMVFGMILVLVGAQIVAIGLFARVFSYSERLRKDNRRLERVLRSMSLERGLAAGAALFVVGASGSIYEFARWAASGFGTFNGLRAVIISATVLFLGILVIFSSCFLSMLGISRDVYIGDYDLVEQVDR